MKTLPSALAVHIATRNTTLATALRITRRDGAVYAFTTHDIDDVVGGVAYLARPGLAVSDIIIAANAAVGNLQLTTLHDGTVFTTADVLGGKWRNAAFTIFRYNWASISDGIDTLLSGTLGEFTLLRNSVTAELRDFRQYLQQAVGDASSKTCRARLGDARCKKDLTSFAYAGLITAVTDTQTFADSSRTEALQWFNEGEITFTSGDNDGISAKIKTFAAGVFTLAIPLILPVLPGDSYIAVAGCMKRVDEDCHDKFDNAVNFVGEPHRKGMNDLTAPPSIAVVA
jgi:uncharacterized phage protein (TIGR02218 family)